VRLAEALVALDAEPCNGIPVVSAAVEEIEAIAADAA
jgi:hypothetical protein